MILSLMIPLPLLSHHQIIHNLPTMNISFGLIIKTEKILNTNILLLNNIFSFFIIKYYDFYYPYQPCTMENVIFDSSGILIKDNNKNINYLFEDIYPGNKIFRTVKKLEIYNSVIYTRVIKVPRNQFYFENKKNNYIQARRDPRSLIDPNYKQFFIIDENLSEYDFFYNQPILINNLIKMITYIDGGIFRITDNFTSRDLDLENIDINNLQIYFGKKNIQNIY